MNFRHHYVICVLFSVAKKEILGIMNKTISKARSTRKENGPVVGAYVDVICADRIVFTSILFY